jgi:hypothetical protein
MLGNGGCSNGKSKRVSYKKNGSTSVMALSKKPFLGKTESIRY